MNDAFLAIQTDFLMAFENLVLDCLRQRDHRLLEGLFRLKELAGVRQPAIKKQTNKAAVDAGLEHADVLRAWITTADSLVGNLKAVLGDLLPRLAIYLSAIAKVDALLRPAAIRSLQAMASHLDSMTTVDCLRSLQQAFSVTLLTVDIVESAVSSTSGSLR
jgi:hypothetical protein